MTREGSRMPVHDWTKVDAGIFHAFHHHWISVLDTTLNGLLPAGYYSLPEQVAGLGKPDVLALQLNPPNAPPEPTANGSHGPSGSGGGIAVATAPPKARYTDQTDEASIVRKTKSVVIRHTSGHRIVALVEIISPGNKGSTSEVESLVEKAVQFLQNGVHLVILDLFPPGPRDPQGLHPLIWSQFKAVDFALPPDKPLTLAAYAAGAIKRSFVEPVAVGDALPELPLFLTPDTYILVPLDATYRDAWAKMPRPWRDVLEPPRGG